MKKLIQYGLLSTVLVPLFIFANIFFPFVFSKVFVFSLIVSFTGTVFLIHFLRDLSFRQEIILKIQTLLRNPIFIGVIAFVGISLVSVLFAYNPFDALWGNIERMDGFLTLITLFGFFLLSILTFEKKNWVDYLKLSVVVSIVVVVRGLWQGLVLGAGRPESFFGNPAFFAGFLLFSLFSAVVVWQYEQKNIWWRVASIFLIASSVLGIVLSQTRGTLLAFFAGTLLSLVYILVRGQNKILFSFSLRKISLGILVILFAFGALFWTTRRAPVWQSVPGFSRLAVSSVEDDTTSSRLLVWKMSLDAVNPQTQVKEFLIGWGGENSTYALGKFYNPLVHKYDPAFFDRSHNKFLDVLVMTGIFGFLAYLLIWFFAVRAVVRQREFSWQGLAIVFFLSSFFVHLFFVFDQFPTSLTLFFVLAFVVSEYSTKSSPRNTSPHLIMFKLIAVFVFIAFVFVRGNFMSFLQMKMYLSPISQSINKETVDKVSRVLQINSPAQFNVQEHFLKLAYDLSGKYEQNSDEGKTANAFVEESIKLGKLYAEENPKHFRFFSPLANTLNRKFELSGDIVHLERSEYFMRKALDFAPKRQELINNLAFNLTFQGRFEEAIELVNQNIANDELLELPYYYKGMIYYLQGPKYLEESFNAFEKAFDLKDDYFMRERSRNTKAYGDFLAFFYKNRDKENFIRASERLIKNEYPLAEQLQQVMQEVENNRWPMVDFK